MTLAQRLALLKGNRNLNRNADGIEDDIAAVSYTHLTLPTNREV